jgi:hypothetical protein
MRAIYGNDKRPVHRVIDSAISRPSPQRSSFFSGRDTIHGHNFGRIPVQAPAHKGHTGNQSEDINGSRDDDDPIHKPLIDQFRQREHLPLSGKDKNGDPEGPSDAEIKYGGLLMPCPDSTKLASAVNLQSAALAAGFRTAYGIHAQMAVLPDSRTWDGTAITETVDSGSNSCPDSFKKGKPCSAGLKPFIVGAPNVNTGVGGFSPGARNRFWDFHVTHVRPTGVSLLHDKTRNPADLSTCSTVCKQQYHCGGKVIGNHTITRTYRKGKFNNYDVTLVDVTKT